MRLKRITEYHISPFMANHEMFLSVYQKRKGVAIANLFWRRGITSSFLRRQMSVWSCQQTRAGSRHQLEMPQAFSHIKCTEYVIHIYQIFYIFWITVPVELISLQHYSSRNRKILRHIVHILKFLASLSRIIKHQTPKLVTQAAL